MWLRRRYEDALLLVERSASASGKSGFAHHIWGAILNDQGKYAQAIEEFKIAEKAYPHSGEIYVSWAFSLDRLNDKEEALKKYERAVSVDPSLAVAYQLWGDLLVRMERTKESLDKFKRAATLDPLNYRNFLWIGRVQSTLGNKVEGVISVNRATQLAELEKGNSKRRFKNFVVD